MSKVDVVKVLKSARTLVEKPGAWMQHWYSKDSDNRCCDPNKSDAVCFCAIGAVFSVLNKNGRTPLPDYIGKHVQAAFASDDVYPANDNSSTKQEHVLMAFDFAILMAQDELKVAKKAAK